MAKFQKFFDVLRLIYYHKIGQFENWRKNMYLNEICGSITSKVKIKYDCDGGFNRCGKEFYLRKEVAQKNFSVNNGKHICKSCTLKIKNPMQLEIVKAKVKKTNLDLYGSVMPVNSKKNIEARKELFKNEEYVEQIVEKRKKTCLNKYGTEFAQQNESVKECQRQTMQERYGVDHPYQSPEIMAKMKAKNKEKYGVENVAQLSETQAKMVQTNLERYGFEHYNQLPEMKSYLREHCKEWLAESYLAGGPNKGIVRPEAWNQKQRETVSQLIVDGKWKAGYRTSKKGFCFPIKSKKPKVYFRSSYEAIYCYYLDHNEEVEWFDFEAFRIPYEHDNQQHFYIPDFLIKWKNSEVLSIKELKAEFMREDKQQQAKELVGTLFAKESGMDYELLFCKDILALEINFTNLEQIGFVK